MPLLASQPNLDLLPPPSLPTLLQVHTPPVPLSPVLMPLLLFPLLQPLNTFQLSPCLHQPHYIPSHQDAPRQPRLHHSTPSPQQAGNVQLSTTARLVLGSLERPSPSMPLWSLTTPQTATHSTSRTSKQHAPPAAADPGRSEASSAALPQLSMHPRLTETPRQVQADRWVPCYPGCCILCCMRTGFAVVHAECMQVH